MWYQHPVIIYFILINFLTFFLFGIDKAKSRTHARRIRERTLWIVTLIGGSIGALFGMHMFRHKTKKLSFQAMIAVILAIQILLMYIIFSN